MVEIGNDVANNFWEWKCPDNKRLENSDYKESVVLSFSIISILSVNKSKVMFTNIKIYVIYKTI